MFPAKVLLSCLLLALTVADARSTLARDTGKAALKFVANTKLSGFSNLAEQDRARAQALKRVAHLGKRSASESVGITNAATHYTAEVGIGEPATNYSLLIDTGSSNTWVGANQSYTPTASSIDTGNTVSISYGSGNFTGEEWLDTVRLSTGLMISNQSIGVANVTNGITADGILGVGPVDLTTGTVSNTDTVPTVTDNLYSQGFISEEVLGVYFVPASATNSTGELTFGGYDNTVITGSVNYVPLTTTSPASTYWGIDQSIDYGGSTILNSTAGIVDTGTTLVLLATDAFQRYQSITGGVMDNSTGLLSITQAQYANLQNLTFNVGGIAYDLVPNAQIWPRSLNTAIGGNSSSIYLIVSDIGNSSGTGLDFMNGFTFLERFYSIYDTANGRVGFAETAYTSVDTN